MNNDDLFRRAKSLSVYDIVKTSTTLLPNVEGKRWYQGPCPDCGGNDRFFVDTRKNVCGCRKCDFGGDAAGAWAGIRKISHADAARELLGESKPPPEWKPTIKKAEVKPDPRLWEKSSWQTETGNIVQKDYKFLFDDEDDGIEGLLYLQKRGIDFEVARRFRVGYNPAYKANKEAEPRPAISIPWFYKAKLIYVKYRFIDDGRQRFSSRYGGNPLLFGSHARVETKRVNIGEGEINALSVASSGFKCETWSIGSQGNEEGIRVAVRLAIERGHEEILFWFDEIEWAIRAKEIATQEGFTGKIGCLISHYGDANDILVRYGREWLHSLICGAFAKIGMNCDYCGGLRVLPMKIKGLYQVCPHCTEKEDVI